MKSFRADYVFPVYADPIKNGIVTIDDSGKIVAISDGSLAVAFTGVPVEQLNGTLCPGFVNTHCHLELSHLKGKIEPGNGLVDFITAVQKLRGEASEADILEAATKADEEMYRNGIVAVGDVVNSPATIQLKTASKLYYHNFIEVFGFTPGNSQELFNQAVTLLNQFKPQSCSITPHAPYSVSKELFKLIQKYSETGTNLISIHNQECEDENRFYRYKLGSFNDLYARFGIDISHFKPQARNSVQSVLSLLSNKQQVLLVHNTCTNLKDIYFIKRFDRKVNFCFCPDANLFIEGRLPKVELFIGQGYNLTLGTDSLASNTNLCMLSAMRTLQQKFPVLNTRQLIEWATVNGAKYLGTDEHMGTLEPGKTPGLNLLTNMDGLKITAETKVKRLI